MSLEQVGQKLKAAREAQNLSLGQVYDRTRIPTNHLEAIEFGRVDDLPEPVYVAGFIKRYGDTLGLSGQALADEYKRAGLSDGQNKPGIFGIGRGRETPPPTVSYVAPTGKPRFSPLFMLWLSPCKAKMLLQSIGQQRRMWPPCTGVLWATIRRSNGGFWHLREVLMILCTWQ